MNYVHWYSHDRRHSELDYLSPEEYEQAFHDQATGSPSGDVAKKKTACGPDGSVHQNLCHVDHLERPACHWAPVIAVAVSGLELDLRTPLDTPLSPWGIA